MMVSLCFHSGQRSFSWQAARTRLR